MSRNDKPLTRAARQALAAEEVAGAPDPMLRGSEEPTGEDVWVRRPIRSEHRGDMLDLKDMANRLADLSAGHRRTLPLDAETQDVLDLLARSEGAGRRRVLMLAKRMLGAVDLVQLEAALHGDTPAAARDRECIRWRTRLVGGDDAVLQEFIEAHPGADRQAIRTSTRDARGTGPAAERARLRLLQLLRDVPAEEASWPRG